MWITEYQFLKLQAERQTQGDVRAFLMNLFVVIRGWCGAPSGAASRPPGAEGARQLAAAGRPGWRAVRRGRGLATSR